MEFLVYPLEDGSNVEEEIVMSSTCNVECIECDSMCVTDW